jgi:STE24 endopeptidase
MNWMIILTILVTGISALKSLVDILNWRHARIRPVPAEFSSLMPPEKQTEALAYLKAQTGFRIFQRSLWTLTFLVFLWAGGFTLLDEWATGLGRGPILTGLFFFAALAVLAELFSLPFSYYSTFALEERFGFNRSTFGTFVGDHLKGYFLGILLGGPLLAAVLWFFLETGSTAWIWVWALLTAFQLVMGFLAPVLLMPLFNKFSSLPEGELKSAIEGYAASVNFKLQGIFTMDGSKRSSKANAFFTGLGRFRRIVLFDTLVKKHTTPELVAVLAHEVGHFKMGHIVKGLGLSILSTLVLLFLLSRLLVNPEISFAFGFSAHSVHSGLTVASWFFGPLSLLLGVAAQAFSRKNEFEADAYAVATTGKGADLVEALKRLSADQLANFNPHPWKVWLEYSHPPLLQRVEAIRASSAGRT